MAKFEINRRGMLGLMGGGVSAGALFGASPLLAQSLQTVNYMFAFPVMSNIVANQTSIPNYFGIFEDEGLVVEHNVAPGSSTAALQLVARGGQNIASGGIEPALHAGAAGEGMGLTFFYNQVRKDNTSVVVKPDSSINTLEDLAGKSIGVQVLGSGPEQTLRLALSQIGMDPDVDVSFINVGVGGQAAQAVQREQVDAYVSAIGTISGMEAHGIDFKFLPMPDWVNDVVGPGLITSHRYLEENRDVCVAIGRSVARCTVFVLNNPEAAIRIHWHMYPEQVPQGVTFDEALETALIGMERQVGVLQFQEGDDVQKFGYMSDSAVERMLIIQGVDDVITDPSPYFTNELVDEINDFDPEEMVELARNFTTP